MYFSICTYVRVIRFCENGFFKILSRFEYSLGSTDIRFEKSLGSTSMNLCTGRKWRGYVTTYTISVRSTKIRWKFCNHEWLRVHYEVAATYFRQPLHCSILLEKEQIENSLKTAASLHDIPTRMLNDLASRGTVDLFWKKHLTGTA